MRIINALIRGTLTNMEKTPAELEAEKQALANTDGSAVGNNQQPIKTKEQFASELAEKYKELPADQLFEKIAEEFAKKEEIISHKNRAIDSLKSEKKQEAPVSSASLDTDAIVKKAVDEAVAKISGITNQQQVETMINSSTTDENERKLIKDAYENSIVKTGDLQQDLKKAFAIANASVIDEIRKNKSEAEANELIMTKFSAGQNYGKQGEDNVLNTPAKKAAAENLRKLGMSEDQIKKAIASV